MSARPYIRISATRAEASELASRAKKRKITVSDLVREAAQLSGRDAQANNPKSARGTARNGLRRIKIQMTADEVEAVDTAAEEMGATNNDYLRMLLGFDRLRPGRSRGGAPIGNRNRTRKPRPKK